VTIRPGDVVALRLSADPSATMRGEKVTVAEPVKPNETRSYDAF
jgi:hypothetical protein